MKLGGNAIKGAIDQGIWEAYRLKERLTSKDLKIGPNSVDVTLHKTLLRPKFVGTSINPVTGEGCEGLSWEPVDCTNGFMLRHGQFVLGAVNERFVCDKPLAVFASEDSARPFTEVLFAPMYEGRSTCGRIGLMSHITAGFGDHGFSSPFVLEISSVFCCAIVLTAGMRIGQIAFEVVVDPIPYDGAYKENVDGPVPPVLGPGRF